MTRPLIVALHGVGSSARDMAVALAPLNSIADVVAVDGTDAFDGGGPGRQWFSVRGVSEADRPQRVLAALPSLLKLLDKLATEHDLAREDLVLLGFSQGAIMTLGLVAQGHHAGRAIAVAGRLAAPIVTGPSHAATLLLVHDLDDPVMPSRLSDEAGAQLIAAGHHVEIARTMGIAHGLGPATINAIANWLVATPSSPSLSCSKG